MQSLSERRKYREAKEQEQKERATHASDTAQLLASQRVKALGTKEELGDGSAPDDKDNSGGNQPSEDFGDMTNAELENYIKTKTGEEPKSRLKADLIKEAEAVRDAETNGGGWGNDGGGLTS